MERFISSFVQPMSLGIDQNKSCAVVVLFSVCWRYHVEEQWLTVTVI